MNASTGCDDEDLKGPLLGYFRGQNLVCVRPLSDEEYATINDAKKTIEIFEEEQRPFKILCACLDEMLEYMKEIENGYLKPAMNRTLLDDSLTRLNGLLISLLTAFRTYTDHFTTAYSRRYGKDSPEVNAFKRFTNEAYDNYFAYRFFSNIRDFAQHCGMPVTDFSLTSRFDEKTQSAINESKAVFRRDHIIEKDKKMRTKFKEELLKQAEELGIYMLVTEFEDSLMALNGNVIALHIKGLIKSVRHIEGQFAELGLAEGDMPIIVRILDHSDPKLNLRLEHFPFEAMSKIEAVYECFRAESES